jgi:hypothetical protein
MTTTTSPAVLADYTIARILIDQAGGTLPTFDRLRTFADLHDYVDANEYLIDGLEVAGEEFAFSPEDDATAEEVAAYEDQTARTNKAMDLVNEWLAQR